MRWVFGMNRVDQIEIDILKYFGKISMIVSKRCFQLRMLFSNKSLPSVPEKVCRFVLVGSSNENLPLITRLS